MATEHVDVDSELLLNEEREIGDAEGLTVTSGTGQSVALPQSKPLKAVWTRIRKSWVIQEIGEILKLAIPIIVTMVLQQLLLFVSILFVGHITGRSLELDAVGLAYTFVNVTGLSVGMGLGSGAETLFTQTYGYKNYKRVGIILQRGILILGITVLPIFAIWLNTETLALLLHQSPCVARLTAKYVQLFCSALPSILLFYLLQVYLQAQGIVWTFVVVLLLTNVISAFLHWILIFPAQLGLIGAAIALIIAFNASPILLIIYICARGLHKKTWGGLSWESLNEWGQFLKLGAPGLLMVCIEWWSFEIAAFVTGSIDDTQLAINSILINLFTLLWQVPYGLSLAATVRVGNELGAGNPLSAKRATYTAVGIMACIVTVIAIVLGISRHSIGKLFTDDQEVIDGVATAMYVGIPLLFSDHIQGTIAGVLKGSGRQVLGAVVNFICYYIIGLPLGISLALAAHLGTFGMWAGLATADTLQALVFIIVILKTNWKHESERAQKNAQGQGQGTVDESDGGSEGEEQSQLKEIDDENTSQEKMAAEIPLVSFTNSREQLTGDDHESPVPTPTAKSRIKLLLYKSTFFIVGILLFIGGGIASRYHPAADFSDCHNYTNSSS